MLKSLVELGNKLLGRSPVAPIAPTIESKTSFPPDGWKTVESMELAVGSLFREKNGTHVYRVTKIDDQGGIDFEETSTGKTGVAGAQADWSDYEKIEPSNS